MKAKNMFKYGLRVAIRAYIMLPFMILATPFWLLFDWMDDDLKLTVYIWKDYLGRIESDLKRMGDE